MLIRKIEINSEAEEEYLDDWINADQQNEALFKKITAPSLYAKDVGME